MFLNGSAPFYIVRLCAYTGPHR